MAVITNKTFLNSVTLDIGTDTYTSAFRDAAIVPTTVEVPVVDASGATAYVVGPTTYRFTAQMFQDWTSTGLAKKWTDTQGSQVTIKYKLPGVQGVFTIAVLVKPVQIGGATNSLAEGAIDLPVVSGPTWAAS